MSRRPTPAETRLWSIVAATVRPMPGRAPSHPAAQASSESRPADRAAPALRLPVSAPRTVTHPRPATPPQEIEPRRRRKIARGRSPLEASLDLHGHDQIGAEAALKSFLLRAFDQGQRAALVITGRGVQGSGILRRRVPEWLAAADLRHIVAGFSESHQKHGGEGALYVALKRKTPG